MPEARSRTPALSVVIVTRDQYATIQNSLWHLYRQSVRNQLEVVIVAPSVATVDLSLPELHGFYAVRVVAAGKISWRGAGLAVGIRHARAPIVALVEDHSFPAPTWAEALIAVHQEPWGGVGYSMGNANPESLIRWANLFLDYGKWVDVRRREEQEDIPGHNSSYKRAVLLEFGQALAESLRPGRCFHGQLRAQGHKLCVEPSARTFHTNVTRLPAWLELRFQAGRIFGDTRAQNGEWSVARRLLYFLGGPLIFLIWWRLVLRWIRCAGRHNQLLPRIYPALFASLIAQVTGEMVGSVTGPGRSSQWLSDNEFDRLRNVSSRDKQDIVRRVESLCSQT